MPIGLAAAIPAMVVRRTEVAPPLGFRGAEGVRDAWPTGEGPFKRTPNNSTGAQRAGKRYERQAMAFLYRTLGSGLVIGKWFRFVDRSGIRYCQLDGLFNYEDGVVIFECKIGFTSDAYFQLRRLYEPVVQQALRPKRISLVIVCRRFDPYIPFPEKFEQIQIAKGWKPAHDGIGVFQWKRS